MEEAVDIWQRPASVRSMIAGWHQWADAGSISSGLPQYLVDRTRATKIGRIHSQEFYLFQIPGAHHFLRPVVKLDDGHRVSMERKLNEFYHAAGSETDFVIFIGEEPHLNEDGYAEAFLDAVEALGVERVVAVAGVYGPVPYDRDRDISCVYSLREMRDDLTHYGVRFSSYEGGATISTYIADQAESRGIPFLTLYGLVPCYDFSAKSSGVQRAAMGEDFKAWYDLMSRLDRLLDLGLDLSDLRQKADDLIVAWDDKLQQLAEAMPQLGVADYVEKVNADFEEESADHSQDVWEDALKDLFE